VFLPPAQVIQLSDGYATHCMTKLEPSHSSPLAGEHGTAPGAETVRGWRLALPYWSQ